MMVRLIVVVAAVTCLIVGCSSPADVVVEAGVGAEGIARVTGTTPSGETNHIDLELSAGGRTAVLGPDGLLGLAPTRIEILSPRCIVLGTIMLEGVDLSNGGLITLDRAGSVRWIAGGRPPPGDGPTTSDACP